MADRIHVVPINDLREHADTADCWCEPQVLEEGHLTTSEGIDVVARIIVHEALDGRP